MEKYLYEYLNSEKASLYLNQSLMKKWLSSGVDGVRFH